MKSYLLKIKYLSVRRRTLIDIAIFIARMHARTTHSPAPSPLPPSLLVVLPFRRQWRQAWTGMGQSTQA